MSTLGSMVVKIGANVDGLERALSDSSSGIASWAAGIGATIASAGAAVVAGAATLAAGALAGVGAAAWEAGLAVDSALDSIVTLTGATGDELAGLEQDFEAVFTSIPVDADAAAGAIAILNQRLGATGPGLQDMSSALLEASRLLGSDATASAERFTRVMGDWGIGVEHGADTLDMLFRATQETGIGMDALMSRVVQFGSPMRLMGFSLEEAIALFGQFEAQGVNSELVMGSLRIAAGKFASEGRPLRDSLLETFDAIRNNTDASEALSVAMDTFGARAGPDMAAAIREGRFELDDLLAVLEDSGGAIADTAAATGDFGEKLQVLKNKATMALEPLGTAMMEGAGYLIDLLAPALERVLPIVTDLGERAAGALGDLMGFISGLSGVFQAGGLEAVGRTILGTILPPELAGEAKALFSSIFGPALGSIGDLLTGKVSLAEMIPPEMVDLGGAVMGFLSEMGAWWTANGPGITESAAGLFAQLQETAQTLAGNVLPWLSEKLGQFGAWFTENGPLIQEFVALAAERWGNIAEQIGLAWQVVQPILDGLISLILGLATTIMAVATGDWTAAWDAIKETAGQVWVSIQEAAVGFVNWVAGWVGSSFEEIKTTWADNWDMFVIIVTHVWEQITTGIATWAANLWSGITSFLGNIVTTWKNNWDMAVLIVTTIWSNIVTGVTTAAGNLWTAITSKIEAIRSAWGSAWHAVHTILATVWSTIVTTATTKIAEVAAGITTKIEAIKSGWSMAWEAVKTTFGTILAGIVTTATTKIAEVRTVITTKIEEIRSWIAGKVAAFTSIGSDLLGGLVAGIRSAAANLITAVTGAIEDALAAARALLGINSPSRVFAYLGEMSIAGFALALEDTSPIERAMTDVFEAAAQLPPGSRELGSGDTDNSRETNITVNATYRERESDPAQDVRMLMLAYGL